VKTVKNLKEGLPCDISTFYWRENSVTSFPRFTAMQRYPSNLISKIHFSFNGNAVTGLHSMGSTNAASARIKSRVLARHAAITLDPEGPFLARRQHLSSLKCMGSMNAGFCALLNCSAFRPCLRLVDMSLRAEL
jgi:hypothetical protein